jgi:hypothetical protein
MLREVRGHPSADDGSGNRIAGARDARYPTRSL